jgi:hypothetical protein
VTRKRPVGTISFGVFLITLGIAFFAYLTDLITRGEIIPLIAVLNGIGILILAAARQISPAEYEMSAFLTGLWGVIILGGGALWLLGARGVLSTMATLTAFVVLIGILAVVAGFREWMGKNKRKVVT